MFFSCTCLQVWLQREQSLLNEIANLRQEARLLLALQTQQQQRPAAAAAAAAAVPDAASSVAGPGMAASSSGSVDPAYSNSPAAGGSRSSAWQLFYNCHMTLS
jgi:2-keto-3-deoxy-galactonokinase